MRLVAGLFCVAMIACSANHGLPGSSVSGPGGGGGGTPLPPLAPPPASTSASNSNSSLQGLTTLNGNIVQATDNSQIVTLRGINWFGFDANVLLNGMNEGTDTITGDFATIVYRLQLLGFNAVRLPFSFSEVLGTTVPATLATTCTFDSNQQIEVSTNPNNNLPNVALPPQRAPVKPTPSQCNSYIPHLTDVGRFSYMVQFLVNNGFYVILTNRVAADTTVANSNVWVQDWQNLLGSLTSGTGNPNIATSLIIDLIDEPDEGGLSWTDLNSLYIAALDSLTTLYPNTLFLVEGTGQTNAGANPGDGFITNTSTIASNNLGDPNPFLKALVGKKYLAQVGLAPHVWPPSVTGVNGDTGSTLWARLSNSFGVLNQAGYCPTTACHTFAVIMGTFGSPLTSPTDIKMMNDLASYMFLSNGANDGKHNAVKSWVWSAWDYSNPENLGSLLDNTYKSIVWNNVAYLDGANSAQFPQNLGLVPWYQ